MANQSSFCHVFLSFKGETREIFVYHLHDALKDTGLEVFMDKTCIQEGDEVDVRIRQGLQNSMSAIVVLSENYASSTWCLEELRLILERKKTSRYLVIPIFYQVTAADVRLQLGSYGKAIQKHKKRYNEEKVKLWKEALEQAGNILGHNFQGELSDFIKDFVAMFAEKYSAMFDRCHTPLPRNHVIQQNPSTSCEQEQETRRDKVVLYHSEDDKLSISYLTIKGILNRAKAEIVERNCTREPRYLEELQNLLGNNGVLKLPTVIVNGKDLRGDVEVEGLDTVRNSVLNLVTYQRCHNETMNYLRVNIPYSSRRGWFRR